MEHFSFARSTGFFSSFSNSDAEAKDILYRYVQQARKYSSGQKGDFEILKKFAHMRENCKFLFAPNAKSPTSFIAYRNVSKDEIHISAHFVANKTPSPAELTKLYKDAFTELRKLKIHKIITASANSDDQALIDILRSAGMTIYGGEGSKKLFKFKL